MKNKKIWLGMLAMALVFGMMVIGCDNNTTNGGGGGYITITGIPATYNGRWAGFEGWHGPIDILGAASVNTQTGLITLVQISNGRVSIPAWTITAAGLQRFSGYTTTTLALLVIHSVQTIDVVAPDVGNTVVGERMWEHVVYSGGNATLTWASGIGQW